MHVRTRFAPSPTGPLHLGHAFSALRAHDIAVQLSGEFLLRIEDIDQSRSKPAWEAQIYDDLSWLGLRWPTPVLRQSDRYEAYRAALQELWDRNAIFQCRCNRKDILAAISAPQEGGDLPVGPDGVIYPGTCRKTSSHVKAPSPVDDVALRLDMSKAVRDKSYSFMETGAGPNGETGLIAFDGQEVLRAIGDVVLARRDIGTSYHLSVVLDDAAQAITHVVRGQDLFEATKIHVVLQHLLGLPTPIYHHHRLIRDEAGKRLAKRDDARAILKYREDGVTADQIRAKVGL
ncbi:tRNA glutamyl-Q(34) synthetase GluQRS [uncultured Litoreibacter sp.]|uniref:tRNA glutamyl-Q(34) synthetase GluQRS n=1 Tax=uncultured Litoreibacter sp. TaxID=1392394 RepID=UPI00260DC91C|nr:tRNA glutamyl-Q(34) synthetase GluQRS [uncultured Litoreibacter sp.]